MQESQDIIGRRLFDRLLGQKRQSRQGLGPIQTSWQKGQSGSSRAAGFFRGLQGSRKLFSEFQEQTKDFIERIEGNINLMFHLVNKGLQLGPSLYL